MYLHLLCNSLIKYSKRINRRKNNCVKNDFHRYADIRFSGHWSHECRIVSITNLERLDLFRAVMERCRNI